MVHPIRDLQLKSPASKAKVLEFVAWYRGAVAAADFEPTRHYLDQEQLRMSYVKDMTAVLNALELVVGEAPEKED